MIFVQGTIFRRMGDVNYFIQHFAVGMEEHHQYLPASSLYLNQSLKSKGADCEQADKVKYIFVALHAQLGLTVKKATPQLIFNTIQKPP